MKALVVREAEKYQIEEIDVPEPGPGQIRVRVYACGVCHSDHFTTDGLWPGLELPKVPGHEIAGIVDALGEGVERFEVGDRVGVGWHGGHDGTCDPCLRGQFIHCEQATITGIGRDGGYAEYAVADAVAAAPIPEDIGFSHAGPLLCAGVTTFNALRNSGARSGDLVAVQGLGGLGHLGVQYARAMGFETVAVSRGDEKREFAEKLGAHHYVDSEADGFEERMQGLGGARVILATAPDADAVSALVPGLSIEGCLMIAGAPFEPLRIGAIDLLGASRRVQGWSSGTAIDSEDTMEFSALHGIEPMVETFPLDEAPAAVDHMMSGKARFRAVLDVAGN